jgi:hypothetical protein
MLDSCLHMTLFAPEGENFACIRADDLQVCLEWSSAGYDAYIYIPSASMYHSTLLCWPLEASFG